MEISLLLTLDLREQAALQAALVTHGAPDCLVTLALTGACRNHAKPALGRHHVSGTKADRGTGSDGLGLDLPQPHRFRRCH